MLKHVNKNNRGFTIVEIIVVLLLISIVAATVFQRSISNDQMDFRSRFDKIQNQLRYPQSIAMKRSEWWGFACDTTDYWIFTGTNETIAANQRLLPGQQNTPISLNPLGVTMDSGGNPFTVIFDPYGIPYSPDWLTPMTNELTINLSDSETGTRTGSINIIPETGFIR
jgi:prepilin-type N-terminal cleavage/methylation domain-containing protein